MFFHKKVEGKRIAPSNTTKKNIQKKSPRRANKFAGLSRKQQVQAKIRYKKEAPWYNLAIAILVVMALAVLLSAFPSYTYSGETYEENSESLVIDFVGDVMLGRYIMSLGESVGYDSIFENVTTFWENADLVFANLESAVLLNSVSEYEEADKPLHLYSTYEGLEAAMDAGINVWACANNHAVDYGEQAILELIDYFESNGIVYSGIGTSLDDAASYWLIEQNGMKIAFLSITEVFFSENVASDTQGGVFATSWADYNMLVYQASQVADFTVVYIHWGEENETTVNETQVAIGHQLADAGADIIIGSHPHVLQEVELYEDSIIFYSLGNFIFDQGNTYAKDSVMVEYTVDQNGDGAFRLYTVRINDGVPYITTNWFYQARINRELSQGLEDDSYYIDDDGFIVIPFDVG